MRISRQKVEKILDRFLKPETAELFKNYLARAEDSISKGRSMQGVYRDLLAHEPKKEKTKR